MAWAFGFAFLQSPCAFKPTGKEGLYLIRQLLPIFTNTLTHWPSCGGILDRDSEIGSMMPDPEYNTHFIEAEGTIYRTGFITGTFITASLGKIHSVQLEGLHGWEKFSGFSLKLTLRLSLSLAGYWLLEQLYTRIWWAPTMIRARI